MTELTQLSSWKALESHSRMLPHMRELFATDPKRFDNLSLSTCGLFLDYSKNKVTNETLSLLFTLAQESQLASKIQAMFNGEKINTTEQRAVLHSALRANPSHNVQVDGNNILPEIQDTLNKMTQFVD